MYPLSQSLETRQTPERLQFPLLPLIGLFFFLGPVHHLTLPTAISRHLWHTPAPGGLVVPLILSAISLRRMMIRLLPDCSHPSSPLTRPTVKCEIVTVVV